MYINLFSLPKVVETPYPVYFEQALNCARILSRLLPFMLESESKIVRSLCWARQYPSKAEGARAGEGNENDGETNGQSIEEEAPAQEAEIEPLAVILINSIFHLLFLPDFTIEDPNTDFNEDDLQTQQFKTALMWAPGVGSSEKSVFSSTPYDKNRIDILRLMISAFSDSLYQNPDTYDSCSSMWLEVGSSVDTPYAEIVFYSLMNVVLGKIFFFKSLMIDYINFNSHTFIYIYIYIYELKNFVLLISFQSPPFPLLFKTICHNRL